MSVLVKKPDNSVDEIEINSKQIGQDCLDEVCRRMNIVEVDYLGLKIVKKGERNLQWVNLKNPLLQQLQGQQLHWLELRVKYHVEPHLIQQETTRHLVYLEAKKRLEHGKLFVPTKKAAVITALVAQAERGDYNPQHQYDFCPTKDLTDEFKVMVITEHNRMRGMRRSSAEYKLIQEAYPLEDYGLEFWHTELIREDSHNVCKFGVGTFGIVVRTNDHHGTPVDKRIVYSALIGSGTDGRYCDISYRTDDYDHIESMRFKFANKDQAEGFYRAIIESLTFFSSDTVSEEVLEQFTRDLKGTLASLFKEKTTVGKKYMFDIRRTAKEVYDHTRRQLFMVANENPFANISEDGLNDLDKPTDNCSKATKEDETLMCRICMVACIDTVFQCGHVSCQDCARRINECHMCKGSVDPAIHIYLPTSA